MKILGSEFDDAIFLPEIKNLWPPDKEVKLVRKTRVNRGFVKGSNPAQFTPFWHRAAEHTNAVWAVLITSKKALVLVLRNPSTMWSDQKSSHVWVSYLRERNCLPAVSALTWGDDGWRGRNSLRRQAPAPKTDPCCITETAVHSFHSPLFCSIYPLPLVAASTQHNHQFVYQCVHNS